ncbi:hypothetical protein WISP_116671 [Willisornis vidua]|uniref:Uncharacterized protein n=1 Tax=Willisornis vidua TaxID=1566151 RepID=A0ABQ9CTS0_9PASS|nr:hypothetical protein WISP_116671 [Willisornis vidua]
MDEDTTQGCDIHLATDVHMDENTTQGCDILLTSDPSVDEDVFLKADTSLPTHITASHSGVLHIQSIRGPVVTGAKDTVLHQKVLLQGTPEHFHCSVKAMGTNQEHHSTVPMPMPHGDTSGISPSTRPPHSGYTRRGPQLTAVFPAHPKHS